MARRAASSAVPAVRPPARRGAAASCCTARGTVRSGGPSLCTNVVRQGVPLCVGCGRSLPLHPSSRRWRTRRSADAGHVFLGVAPRTARAPVRAPTRRTSPSLPRRHLHPSPPSRVAELYRRLEQHLLRHAHLRLKASKTKVWNCAGLLPPGVPALAPDSLSGSAIPHCPRRSVV